MNIRLLFEGAQQRPTSAEWIETLLDLGYHRHKTHNSMLEFIKGLKFGVSVASGRNTYTHCVDDKCAKWWDFEFRHQSQPLWSFSDEFEEARSTIASYQAIQDVMELMPVHLRVLNQTVDAAWQLAEAIENNGLGKVRYLFNDKLPDGIIYNYGVSYDRKKSTNASSLDDTEDKFEDGPLQVWVGSQNLVDQAKCLESISRQLAEKKRLRQIDNGPIDEN